MEQDTLQAILGVERELREALDLERATANEWLEQSRREIEARRSSETERLREAAAASIERARLAADATCAAAVEQARREAQWVDGLRDDELVRLLRPRLASILPGGVP
jgi:phage terminase Nu1 subunit (DNA packaging protein)